MKIIHVCELTQIGKIMHQASWETQIRKGCHFLAHPVELTMQQTDELKLHGTKRWRHAVSYTHLTLPTNREV